MGRQTPEQKAFVRKHISSYIHYADGKNLGEFWPGIMEEWFRTWPLSDPPADLVEKAGSLENAQKAWKRKKVEVSIPPTVFHLSSSLPIRQKLKRTFRTAGNDNSTSSRRDLHLEDNPTRKKSEVQMYMVLYYDSRIRQTVLERWAEGHVGVESRVESTIPDGDIEPHESCIYRDAKIPITFKNAVAQELFENETVAIKAEVRSKREEGTVKTVYNTRGDQRMELIHDYQRYARSLVEYYPQPDTLLQEHPGAWSKCCECLEERREKVLRQGYHLARLSDPVEWWKARCLLVSVFLFSSAC